MWLTLSDELQTFGQMWYQIFLWALVSSVLVHACAALISFGTLRKHKFGKFFPVLIGVFGVLTPCTFGALSSAALAFVYRASSMPMMPAYAMLWGVGQTAISATVGFNRILATL